MECTKVCLFASPEWILSITNLHTCKRYFLFQIQNILSTKNVKPSSCFNFVCNCSLHYLCWIFQKVYQLWSVFLGFHMITNQWNIQNNISKSILLIKPCSNFKTSNMKVSRTKGIYNKWHKNIESLKFKNDWKQSFSIIYFE